MFRKLLLAPLIFVLVSCGEPIQLSPDAILPDGGVYQGETKNGLFHGHGTLKYSNGSYYEGLFKSGKFHGRGIRQFSNESRYEGDFFEGDMTGQASFSTTDYQYVGSFREGEFEGQGKISYNNGVVYEGEFLNSLYHGVGVSDSAEGGRYEGEFKENYYHGKGEIVYKDGSVYRGQFEAGQYQGQGRFSAEEIWYEGEFVDNQFSGKGEYQDARGNRYAGLTNEWLAHGEGELILADGATMKGVFEYGSLEGRGEKKLADGGYYKGDFQYNEFDGSGVLTNADGSVYDGEFSYGKYHGQGVLKSVDPKTGAKKIIEGRWRNGKLAYNATNGERQHAQADLALENHQALLAQSLSSLRAGDGATNVYFLGVAGDGSQSVFRRELEFVSQQIETRYQTQNRSVLLINDHDTARVYPMATSRSIASAISSVGEKMDNEDDVLFMYLSSHGSSDHDLYLNHDSIRLPDLAPQELKAMLDAANIKWRVIMVSACYAGGFISELEDEHTLLMTAADAESTSFGCSDESEMTYFGKAFFSEVFSKNQGITLGDAFTLAKDLVLKWEKEQGLDASNPMISAPHEIIEKMAAF